MDKSKNTIFVYENWRSEKPSLIGRLYTIIFFPSAQMNKLVLKLCKKHTFVLCSQIIEEINRVTKRKFPDKLKNMDEFLHSCLTNSFILRYLSKKISFRQSVMSMIIPFLQLLLQYLTNRVPLMTFDKEGMK